MKKRFLGILSLILALCLCTAVSASAQAPGKGNVARPQTVYNGITGTVYDGYGTFTCTLPITLTPGYVEAYVQTSNNSGTVDCFLKFPNGTYQYIGMAPATGGSTGPTIIHYMESGDYTFVFESSTDAPLSVSAVIRDD